MIAYKLTCRPTGLIYIGITRYTLARRLFQHFNSAKSDKKVAHKPIYVDMRKYGAQEWSAEVVGTAETYAELLFLERILIAQFGSNSPKIGYNRTEGGQGSLGFRHKKTAEQAEKSARFHRGRKRSLETRQRQREAMSLWQSLNRRSRNLAPTNPPNHPRDCAIACDYFSSPSLEKTGANFGIKAAAVSEAMRRVRRRLSSALESASPIYDSPILPLKIHPDWIELAS